MKLTCKPVRCLVPVVVLLAGCSTSEISVCPAPPDIQPLQAQLSADRANLVVGDTVTFTTTVTNPNSCPLNLFLGQSYSGVSFVNGSALEGRSEKSTWDAKDVSKHQWKTGYCGTCSYALIVAVPANGSIKYTTKATLKAKDKGPYLAFGVHDEYESLVLACVGDGKFVVRAHHEVPAGFRKNDDPEDARWLPKEHNVAAGYAPDAKAPFFQGAIKSNDLTLEISAARKRP